MDVGTSGAGEGISIRGINYPTNSIGGLGGEMAVGGVVGTTGLLREGVFYHDVMRKNGRSQYVTSRAGHRA